MSQGPPDGGWGLTLIVGAGLCIALLASLE